MKCKREWPVPATILLMVFSVPLAGCQATGPAVDRSEEVQLSPGHKVYIRIQSDLELHENANGGEFVGKLGRPLKTGERLIAHMGTPVQGRFVHLDSGVERKRGETRLAIEKIIIGREGYSLRTRPLSFSGHRIESRMGYSDERIAPVGVLSDEPSNGQLGRPVAEAFLLGDLEEAEFGPQTMFAFTLAEATELPANSHAMR